MYFTWYVCCFLYLCPILGVIYGLAQGYRVIGVDYKYDPPGTRICPQQRGNSYKRFRDKKVFGIDEGMSDVNVSPAESILNRITKLLLFLAKTRPSSEGWGFYIDNYLPNWPVIALTGHSQGSGHAAFLAKRFPLYRVMLNSSPWDHYVNPFVIDDWLKAPSQTPSSRWYGLFDAKDSHAHVMRSTYPALGLEQEKNFRVLDLEPQKRDGDFGHFQVLGWAYGPLTANGQQYAYQPDWIWQLGSGKPS